MRPLPPRSTLFPYTTLFRSAGCFDASDEFDVTVTEDPTVDVVLGDDEICAGGMVTMTADVTGGAGPGGYQWQRVVSGNWTNVGTNQGSYTTPALTIGTHQYRVLLTQNSGCFAASAAAVITVVGDPTVTVSALQSSICDGGMAMLMATPTGGTGANHYQWQQLTGGVWVNVGADQNTYTSAPLTLGTYSYRVILTQDAGCEAASSAINITVVTDPGVTISSTSGHTCEAETLTMTVQVTGGAGTPNFQWQELVGGNWTNVGPNAPAYTTPPLPVGPHSYRVIVTQNSGCETVSAPFEVVVTENPTASLGPDETICGGTSTDLTVTPSGGTGPYTYLWSNGDTTA